MDHITWDKNGLKQLGKKLPITRLKHNLHSTIDINGITLQYVAKVIRKDFKFWDNVIQLHSMQEVSKEILSSKQSTKQTLNKIIISWAAESYISKAGWREDILQKIYGVKNPKKVYTKKIHDFSIYLCVSGKVRGRKEEDAIDFINTKEIAHVPIRLDPLVRIYYNEDSKVKIIESGNYYPTVLELFYGIFLELTFYGPPSERDKRKQEIVEMSKLIEDKQK